MGRSGGGSGSVSSSASTSLAYQHQYFRCNTSGETKFGSVIPTGASWVNSSSEIVISADSNSGYGFANWATNTSSLVIQNSTASSTDLIVDSAGTVLANFYPAIITQSGGAPVVLPISGNVTTDQITGISFSNNQTLGAFAISFEVTVASGSVGVINITIPKSLVPGGLIPTIYIEGSPASLQSYTQDSLNYYAFFLTHSGTNSVEIAFAALRTSSTTSSISTTSSAYATLSSSSGESNATTSNTFDVSTSSVHWPQTALSPRQPHPQPPAVAQSKRRRPRVLITG